MTPTLDKKLCEKYPKIFKDRYGDMKTTAMCWGISTDDGWYNLINTLCESIQNYIDNNGYLFNITQVVATQVKEKYGGLRFYINGGNEFIDGMINFAEIMSTTICEVCGQEGKMINDNGWYKTRCKNHQTDKISLWYKIQRLYIYIKWGLICLKFKIKKYYAKYSNKNN